MLAAVVLAEVVSWHSLGLSAKLPQQQMQFAGQQVAQRLSGSAFRPAIPNSTPPPRPPSPHNFSFLQSPWGCSQMGYVPEPKMQPLRVNQTFQPQACWPWPVGLSTSLLPSPHATAKLGRKQSGCFWYPWSHLSALSPAKRGRERRRGRRLLWNLTAGAARPMATECGLGHDGSRGHVQKQRESKWLQLEEEAGGLREELLLQVHLAEDRTTSKTCALL